MRCSVKGTQEEQGVIHVDPKGGWRAEWGIDMA